MHNLIQYSCCCLGQTNLLPSSMDFFFQKQKKRKQKKKDKSAVSHCLCWICHINKIAIHSNKYKYMFLKHYSKNTLNQHLHTATYLQFIGTMSEILKLKQIKALLLLYLKLLQTTFFFGRLLTVVTIINGLSFWNLSFPLLRFWYFRNFKFTIVPYGETKLQLPWKRSSVWRNELGGGGGTSRTYMGYFFINGTVVTWRGLVVGKNTLNFGTLANWVRHLFSMVTL